jgi:hypothetical protein
LRLEDDLRLFLTHDIDAINTGWLQDARAAIVRGKPWQAARPIMRGKNHWNTIHHIIDVEQRHGYTSTFYWLPVKGGGNADYGMGDVRGLIGEVADRGCENGLHRSLSPQPIEAEVERLGFTPLACSYHFHRPQHLGELDRVGIRLNTTIRTPSLKPWRIPCTNVIETGVDFMDGWFVRDAGLSPDDALDAMMYQAELHESAGKQVLVVLWHNSMWSVKYGYGGVYERFLGYCRERGYEGVTPQEIVSQWS